MAFWRDARAAGREPKRVGRARAIQRSTSHPFPWRCFTTCAAVRGVFLCELVGKLFPEETAHPEVYTLFQTALTRVEEEEQVGWIHAEFMGQLIALMGLAPAHQLRLGRMCWTCNRANGSTPWDRGRPLAAAVVPVVCRPHRRNGPSVHRFFLTARADQGPNPLPRPPARGLREIKSYEVLEQVFE